MEKMAAEELVIKFRSKRDLYVLLTHDCKSLPPIIRSAFTFTTLSKVPNALSEGSSGKEEMCIARLYNHL